MYNEFQPKYDCRDQVAVVVDRRSDDRGGDDCLMWTMANGESEWEPDKLKRIRSLLPHVRQAVRVRQELAAAEAQAYADVSTLLEHASLGVIFLDRRGTITTANQVAERLLGVRDGIYPWQGTLRASLPHDDARIRDLVSAALPRLGHLPVGGVRVGAAVGGPAAGHARASGHAAAHRLRRGTAGSVGAGPGSGRQPARPGDGR